MPEVSDDPGLADAIAELNSFGIEVTRPRAVTAESYDRGRGFTDVPERIATLIGKARLDNLHQCVEHVIRTGVPGDLIETGVWRGGATILMRAIVKARGEDRLVWAA